MCAIPQTRITKIAKMTKTRCGDALHKHACATLGNSVLSKMWCCKQSCKQTVQHTKRTPWQHFQSCKQTVLETKLTALRHCFEQCTDHLTPRPQDVCCWKRAFSSARMVSISDCVRDLRLGCLRLDFGRLFLLCRGLSLLFVTPCLQANHLC